MEYPKPIMKISELKKEVVRLRFRVRDLEEQLDAKTAK